MIELPDIAVGAVCAALIAALISLISLIVSKEHKTSEFRQAWIDALRSEIAALIAHGNAIYGVGGANIKDHTELWKLARQDFVAISEASAKIRLRLNPTESEAKVILNRIEEFEQQFSNIAKMEFKKFNEVENLLVSESQILLKKEWARVRAGESVYRIARFAALSISTACAIALIMVSIHSLINTGS